MVELQATQYWEKECFLIIWKSVEMLETVISKFNYKEFVVVYFATIGFTDHIFHMSDHPAGWNMTDG